MNIKWECYVLQVELGKCYKIIIWNTTGISNACPQEVKEAVYKRTGGSSPGI